MQASGDQLRDFLEDFSKCLLSKKYTIPINNINNNNNNNSNAIDNAAKKDSMSELRKVIKSLINNQLSNDSQKLINIIQPLKFEVYYYKANLKITILDSKTRLSDLDSQLVYEILNNTNQIEIKKLTPPQYYISESGRSSYPRSVPEDLGLDSPSITINQIGTNIHNELMKLEDLMGNDNSKRKKVQLFHKLVQSQFKILEQELMNDDTMNDES